MQSPCTHGGFHEICATYDRHRGELVYQWRCERCGAVLREAGRERYRPLFRAGWSSKRAPI